jgi:hypothetical protein
VSHESRRTYVVTDNADGSVFAYGAGDMVIKNITSLEIEHPAAHIVGKDATN